MRIVTTHRRSTTVSVGQNVRNQLEVFNQPKDSGLMLNDCCPSQDEHKQTNENDVHHTEGQE